MRCIIKKKKLFFIRFFVYEIIRDKATKRKATRVKEREFISRRIIKYYAFESKTEKGGYLLIRTAFFN